HPGDPRSAKIEPIGPDATRWPEGGSAPAGNDRDRGEPLRRRLGAHQHGRYEGALYRELGRQAATTQEGDGGRLGHRRILDAAAGDADAHRARIADGTGRRAYPGDPTLDQ